MMKLLFTIVGICISLTLSAQWSGGIKAGLNQTDQKWEVKVYGSSNSDKYNGTSFHIGGYSNYSLNSTMAIQPEILYNSLKADLGSDDLTLSYISVPVLFNYGFDKNKIVFQGGPQLGILLSSDPSEFKDDGYLKTIDFSFDIGAMVNFNKFNITVRYSLGIPNLATKKLNDELEAALGVPIDLAIKNNNLQFSVGYQLFAK